MAIKIKTQKTLEKHIKAGETEFEFVAAGEFEVKSDPNKWIKVSVSAELKWDILIRARGSSRVVAWESSSVEAWESSSVVARGSSSVEAWGSSSVVAWESSSVEARGSSRVVAWGSSRVVARESSSVVAWESSSVEAWESSSVEAWGSSSVEAWGSSSVVARGSSSVVARGSSRVVAWESSRVVAWESSRVVAKGSVSLHLWGLAKATLSAKCHVHIHSKKSKADGGIQTDSIIETAQDWCDYYGVEVKDGVAVLYKALGENFESRQDRNFKYTPGTTPKAHGWNNRECSDGLHFCAHPRLAKSFNPDAKKYAACPVLVSEMLINMEWDHPEKAKAQRVYQPCWEVDEDGNKV